MKFPRYEYIKASLSVFSLANLQDFVTISRSLVDYDIDPSELYEYVSDNQKIFAGEQAKRSLSIKAAMQYCLCPKCQSGIIIEPVNDRPGAMINPADNNGEVYQSLASCRDLIGCGWQKFSNLTQFDLMKSFFPKGVRDGLVELTVTPHGHNDLE